MTKLQNISITSASFWNLVRAGRSGDGAMKLYIFYCQKAIDQNSIQPWASDTFCARRLGAQIKTIATWRKTLQRLSLVEHIQKTFKGKKYYYVKVNHLPVTITGNALHMGGSMTEGECNSYIALDYYAKWLELFRDSERFTSDVTLESGHQVTEETIAEKVDLIWERISEKGYGLSKMDTQFRFYSYMVTSVANEIRETRQSKRLKIA